MLQLSRPNITSEELNAVREVMESGFLVYGKQGKAFESELGEYLNIPHVLTVSSGTAALHLSLVALNIGPGDAVLVPNFTFISTVNVIELAGATPVFVDVEEYTYCINEHTVTDAINNWNGEERIRAIIPVHEFGYPVNFTSLAEIARTNNLLIIEDACCAIGTEIDKKYAGTLGDIGCLSFHPRKSLVTGEGGAVLSNCDETSDRIKYLRNHGLRLEDRKLVCVEPGYNYRMTDLQAAIGRAQLKRLPGFIAKRRNLARMYFESLHTIPGIKLPAMPAGHTWQTYMIVIDDEYDRDNLMTSLREKSIETNIGAQSIVDQDYYKKYARDYMDDWMSRKLYTNGIALPFCESYGEEEVNQVVSAIKELLPLCIKK